MKTSRRKSTAGSVLVNLAGRSLLAAAAFALLGAATVDADLDPNQFGGWSLIGDTDNTKDSETDYGAVNYEYRIGKFEVSKDDWDSAGLSGGTSGSDAPMVNIDLYNAMQFANALTEDAGGTGYYSHDGGVVYSPNESSHDEYAATNGLTYFVPTEDEWYKAAYGDKNDDGDFSDYSDYADGTDTAPTEGSVTPNDGWNYQPNGGSNIGIQNVGFSSLEQNGTRDMMGNVWEWQEDTTGILRGGRFSTDATSLRSSHRHTANEPWGECSSCGFRVVAIPEPVSGELFVLVVGLLWFVRRRARA